MGRGATDTKARPGRNDPCPCGSARKAKRCCELRRGPSPPELARAWLAGEARAAARVLRNHDTDDLLELVEEVGHLPARDIRLQASLPRLVFPELEEARVAIDEEDVETLARVLPAVVARVDGALIRAELARAVLALRDAGAIDRELAAAAIVDLASSSQRLVRNSVLEALAVDAGAVRTPARLLVGGV